MDYFRHAMSLLARAADSWLNHRAPSMGAAIAFYTLFSMAPVGMIALAVAGSVYGHDAARRDVLEQVQMVLGPSAAAAIGTVLDSAGRESPSGWRTAFTMAISLFTATTVFSELKDSLDIIWETPRRKRSTVWEYVRTRLLSFGLVLALGFVLLASMLLSALITALSTHYGAALKDSVISAVVITNVLTLIVVTLLFAAIFKILPEQESGARLVWGSAFLTALLYMLGKGVIAQYLGTTALASSYGAAGALVLILIWIYYSAQIFLYGAELSRQMVLDKKRIPDKK